jgi:hypothetical protein
MKMLTPANYKDDKLYPRVVKAVAELLADGKPVSSPEVFAKMGMLSEDHLKAWRGGKVPYLERVIKGGLGKTNRVVRIISLYAHDLNLPPAPPHSAGSIKHKGQPLRFCKTGERRVEDAFKRVYGRRRDSWKKIPASDSPNGQDEPPAV